MMNTIFPWLKLMIDLSKQPVVLRKLISLVIIFWLKVLQFFVFDPYNKTNTLSFACKSKKMSQLSQAYQDF